jgi:hypothetical protein
MQRISGELRPGFRGAHKALYGSVLLTRVFCINCDGNALVVNGRANCCEKLVFEAPAEALPAKRMSDAAAFRDKPSRAYCQKQLKEQDNRCFYCWLPFGVFVWRGQRRMRLRVEWDHWIPYDYSRNNRDTNFVAACHVCNRIKSCLVFDTVTEARVYINGKREEKGYL